MSRPTTTDTSLCYKTLKVNKIAFEELINRGYDMQELFNNLILSLLQIETDSEIRYSNAKTAIQNLKDERENLQRQRMHEEESKKELAKRESTEKINKIFPVVKWILYRYFSTNKRRLEFIDNVICADILEELYLNKKLYPSIDFNSDSDLFDVSFVKRMKEIYQDVKNMDTETLKKYLTDHFYK